MASLLNAVLRFQNEAPTTTQSESLCEQLAESVRQTIHSIAKTTSPPPPTAYRSEDEVPSVRQRRARLHLDPLLQDRSARLGEFSASDRVLLGDAVTQLSPLEAGHTPVRGDVWTERWFPQYAAALQCECVAGGMLVLRVLALDGWERTLHFPRTGGTVHSAVPSTHAVVHCGRIDVAQRRRVLVTLESKLSEASTRTGSSRSAANKETAGHQKTPPFLVATVRNALHAVARGEEEKEIDHDKDKYLPCGGMTDVGKHTGGEPRDTCWPLVAAVVRQALPGNAELFPRLEIALFTRLFHDELNTARTVMSTRGTMLPNPLSVFGPLDRCFQVLDAIAVRMVQLGERGFDGSQLEDKCRQWRLEVDSLAQSWSDLHVSCFRMPTREQLRAMSTSSPSWSVDTPERVDFSVTSGDSAGVRKVVLSTVSPYEFIDPQTCSTDAILAEYKAATRANTTSRKLAALRSIEAFLYRASSILSKGLSGTTLTCTGYYWVVDWYKTNMATLTGLANYDEIARVKLQSKFLLLSYIAFCLSHFRSCKEYPILKEYKIALDWRRLEVCVLDEQTSREALLAVAKYIRSFNERCSGPPVFDLGNHEGTRKFARHIAPTLSTITTAYEDITRTCEENIDAVWDDIQHRKSQVSNLRREMKIYQDNVREYQALFDTEIERLQALRDEESDDDDTSYGRYGRPPVSSEVSREYKRQLEMYKRFVGSHRSQIKRLVAMREFVVSPLPADRLDALEVLFFLQMPYNLDVVAELCSRAQNALGPITASVSSLIHVQPTCSTSWTQYFNSRKGNATFTPGTRYLTTYPKELEVPKSYGKTTIDQVGSRESFAKSCTWFPVVDGSEVLWNSSGGGHTNPFKIKADISRAQFTAKVPAVDGDTANYQWMNNYPGGLDRSNIPYAKADDAGEAVRDYHAFLALGAVRVSPLQQLRKIVLAIKDDTGDWSKPIVGTVIRQALFQVGELTDHLSPSLTWHADLLNSTFLSTIGSSMQGLLSRIGSSPRRWNSVPLLADLIGFVCSVSEPSVSLRGELCEITRRWAAEVRAEWQKGVPPAEQTELRARECLLYGYALLCFRLGPKLSANECHTMCELVVLFHNAQLFAMGSSLRPEIRILDMNIQEIMADRITELVRYVAKNSSKILTPVCQAVNALIPSELEWKQIPACDWDVTVEDSMPSCFEATHPSNGSHYLVNLFTGSVLSDGAPPGGLPKEVRALPKYIELFGDQDFEVTASKDGVYASVQAFHGFLYRFRVVGKELIAEESHKTHYPSSSGGLQLCRQSWILQLKTKVPVRLIELYSHWYWYQERCVVFRPRTATKKEVSFVLKFTVQGAHCYQVPRVDQCLAPRVILQRLGGYRCFITPDDSLRRALWKFEDTTFTHFLRAPTQTDSIEIELPRYGLRFVQENNVQMRSVEFGGYVLSHNQQLNDQFTRFRRYLLLENASGDCTFPKQKLLVPAGTVLEYQDGTVDVTRPTQSSATIALNVFDSHNRLGVLTAETMESRLQLAAIYTVAGDLIPWPALDMTGGEAAMEILRGCLPTRPFSHEAEEHLTTIKQFASRHTRALVALVALLQSKSRRLSFLFIHSEKERQVVANGVETEVDTILNDALDGLAADVRSQLAVNALRRGLTVAEEWDLLGPTSTHHSVPAMYTQSAQPTIDLAPVPVDPEIVKQEEERLLHLVSTKQVDASRKIAIFPLSERGSNKTSTGMMAELKESWRAHHEHPDGILKKSLADVKVTVRSSLERVTGKRELLLKYLHDSIASARGGWKARLLHRVNRAPTLTIADVVRSVLDDEVLLHLAPRFSSSARRCFKRAALSFLELCVLEDKLERILSRAKATPPPSLEYFVEELACVRKWKTTEHPYWLVFELEGQLQIRPEQYIIARHLIDNPGSISQLNMGRGKTRVILPMLFLYYRYNETARVVRSHFLSPLLSETRQFMHRMLSAGMLRLPFVELPFNRTVDISLREVQLMREAVEEIKENGGFLIMAPEHRLSLELKRQELKNSEVEHKDVICEALDRLMDPAQYIDIFDESDALLHHKYHLVYAVGTPEILDGGSARWLGAQALVRVLMSPKSSRVAQVLKETPDLFCVQLEYSERYGAYNGFRLNAAIEATKKSRTALKRALLEDLIDQAPFELAWLKTFAVRDAATRALLIQAICDCTVSADSVFKLMPAGIEGAKLQLLALRGLLAYGVLESCLEKRTRVTYGLPDPGTRAKSLAIPFTAADLPAERSEFSHPDVSILLTLLAYYHSGLTNKDIHKAFDVLLRLDYSERNRFYDEWYQSIQFQVDPRHRVMLSKLDHLSLDNAFQFSIVCDAYRYSIELINFYLNRLVFPRDTKQYPERLSRSAWDLVRGPMNVGFSGTNDTHRLLPVAVSQREPDEASLRGTNGKMIDLLLTSTLGYVLLEDLSRTTQKAGETAKEQVAKSMWQLLLLQALAKECLALIDTGALLAGVAIDAAAQFLIQEPDFNAAGVTYYDTRKEYDCWVVLEPDRQILRPLKTSSLHERDTFVIFDEARARGSDMKLRPDAVAMLTLGPDITKDKLMQGAGRMRQLGRNQKLWLTSTVEVRNSVLQLVSPSSTIKPTTRYDGSLKLIDGLNWVMENTQQQCTLGLLEWAQNGIQFCAKEIDPENELQDEDWTLESQYNGAQTDELIYDVVRERLDLVVELNDDKIEEQPRNKSDELEHFLDRIDDRAFTYGYEDEVHVSSYGEECERELQVEEEEEVHAEEKAPAMTAAREVMWDVTTIFTARSAAAVNVQNLSVMSLQTAAKQFIYPTICGSNIAWDLAKVYATSNFWTTVNPPALSASSRQQQTIWTSHLRMFDVLVVFSDGSVLALTDLEANMLLMAMASASPASPRQFCVIHLAFACHAIGAHGANAKLISVPMSVRGATFGSLVGPVPVTAIVACSLLNGDTQFEAIKHEPLVKQHLQKLLQPLRLRETHLRTFIEARRFPQRWTRSLLHVVANEMDLRDLK